MKKTFFLFVFICFCKILAAQDVIITTEGEYLDCKIIKVDEEFIYYSYIYQEQTKETLIPRDLVEKFKINNPKQHQSSAYTVIDNDKAFPILRFAVNTGPSYRTGRTPKEYSEDVKGYIRKVKMGYHFGGDFDCLFNETLGFGFKYNRFSSTDKAESISLPDAEGNILTGRIEEDVTISYMGPSMSTSFFLEPAQSLFIANCSIGLIQYKNEASFIDSYVLSGNNMGFSFDVGFDKSLSKNLACGIKIAYVGGYLTQVEIEKGTEKETIMLAEELYESLSRIDLSVGLRFK